MATINIRDDEPLEKAIRRFKKMVENGRKLRELLLVAIARISWEMSKDFVVFTRSFFYKPS